MSARVYMASVGFLSDAGTASAMAGAHIASVGGVRISERHKAIKYVADVLVMCCQGVGGVLVMYL